MKNIFCVTILSLCVFVGPSAYGQDRYDDSDVVYDDDGDRAGRDDYESALQREKYKTAIARERAEQAYQASRERSYGHSGEMQDIYERRSQQEYNYERRTNDISSINQAANTAANIARQVENISRGGRGW